jgi:undecaprenyl-diphosphatase
MNYLRSGWSGDDALLFSIAIFTILLLFLSLTLWIVKKRGLCKEKRIMAWVYGHRNPFFDMLFGALTHFGSLKILLPIDLALSIAAVEEGYPRVVLLANLGFFAAVISVYLIKFIISRERPNEVLSAQELPADPSFPSAHTLQVFSFSIMLWLAIVSISESMHPTLALYLLLLASAVGFSRVYLQVHYLSDIFAGVLLALFWGVIVVVIFKTGVL